MNYGENTNFNDLPKEMSQIVEYERELRGQEDNDSYQSSIYNSL